MKRRKNVKVANCPINFITILQKIFYVVSRCLMIPISFQNCVTIRLRNPISEDYYIDVNRTCFRMSAL